MADGLKPINVKILDSPSYRSFYGEAVYVRSSSTNLYVSLCADEQEALTEKAMRTADGKAVIFTGEISDKGPLRVRQATFGMPIYVALSMVGAILQHLKTNNPNILLENFITLSPSAPEEKSE